MFYRELESRASNGSMVEFHLRMGGPLEEAEAEHELLRLIYAVDAALDDTTGRLKPGSLASSVAARLLISAADPEGYNHIAGITCSAGQASELCRLARERGFKIGGNV
jgi:hypothetical protein